MKVCGIVAVDDVPVTQQTRHLMHVEVITDADYSVTERRWLHPHHIMCRGEQIHFPKHDVLV
jgi:hypothetical protein